MALPVCVFAYTPPSMAPPYMNVSRNDAGDYVITVRSPATPEGRCGETAAMTLPRAQTTELYRALLRDLLKTERA